MVRGGKVFVFDNGVPCGGKNFSFFEKFGIIHHLLTGEVLNLFSYYLKSDFIFLVRFRCCFGIAKFFTQFVNLFFFSC